MKNTISTPNTLIISQRFLLMLWKYFTSSVWAASMCIAVSSTFESILKRISNIKDYGTKQGYRWLHCPLNNLQRGRWMFLLNRKSMMPYSSFYTPQFHGRFRYRVAWQNWASDLDGQNMSHCDEIVMYITRCVRIPTKQATSYDSAWSRHKCSYYNSYRAHTGERHQDIRKEGKIFSGHGTMLRTSANAIQKGFLWSTNKSNGLPTRHS